MVDFASDSMSSLVFPSDLPLGVLEVVLFGGFVDEKFGGALQVIQ